MEVMLTEGQVSQSQRVDGLEAKIDHLTNEVSSITNILSQGQSSNVSNLQQNQGGNRNIWQNTSKVMIMKNNLGTPNLAQLEERVVGEQIQVTNSRTNKNGDIIISL